MRLIISIITKLLAASAAPVCAGVGESAVMTLVTPFGARSAGMGEVGAALADDESALYFNPAGLGMKNRGWRRGSAAYSIEYLLPELDYNARHVAFSSCFQLPSPVPPWAGGFGWYITRIIHKLFCCDAGLPVISGRPRSTHPQNTTSIPAVRLAAGGPI